MTIILPPALNLLVDRLVHSGRYADEADVLREALCVLERQEFDESPALEAAILEGVASPQLSYDASVMDRIRQTARWNRESLRWEACGRSGVGFSLLLTRACPASARNRRVQWPGRSRGDEITRSLTAWTKSNPYARWCGTRAGSRSQSRGPDSAPVFETQDIGSRA
jgi:putative addiction module CopG family antidote